MYCSSQLFPIHIIYALIFPIIRDPDPKYKWVGKSLTCNKHVGFKALGNKQVGFKALVISKSFSSLLVGCVRRPAPRTDLHCLSLHNSPYFFMLKTSVVDCKKRRYIVADTKDCLSLHNSPYFFMLKTFVVDYEKE